MTALLTLLTALTPMTPPPADAENVPFPFAQAETELSADINIDELKAHVYRLASKDFLGRRGPGAARASKHIEGLFKQLKLKPAFGKSYFQPVPNFLKYADSSDDHLGRNVVGIIPGSDPELKDEWIVLSAHFDHLGVRKGVLYPGADDNASGVAMLIEVAERLALSKHKPKRTIVIAAFDLEEVGLLGSRYFAMHPPLDLKKLKVFLTADMLGRSMANVMDDYVFLLGSESSKDFKTLVGKVAPANGLKVGRLGADIIGTRSDYGPFRDRKIPFLFFSSGQHPDYHSPRDLPDRIDYHRLQKICLWITGVTSNLADNARTPVWDDDPQPDLGEVKTIREILTRVMNSPKIYPLNEKERKIISGVVSRLDAIITRGHITASERTWLIWTSRILLVTVF